MLHIKRGMNQQDLKMVLVGPNGSFVSTGACNLEVPGSNPGRAGFCHRGCAYTVLQTVERPGVYSAVYGTVHYKEPLKSFEIKVGHSSGFGHPLSRYCHDCAESDVKQYSYILKMVFVHLVKSE